MSAERTQVTVSATSAGKPMLGAPAFAPMLVGGLGAMLAGGGTSAHASQSTDPYWAIVQTTTGRVVAPTRSAGAAIGELRRISGLTWDQLASVFGVSRRALHFWASGKAMTPANEEHLQRVIAVLRKIDRGAASANRAALLTSSAGGAIPLDLLAEEKYEQALAALGPGGATRVAAPMQSEPAREVRAPRPPEEIVGALHDRVHRDTGVTRAAKSVKRRV